MPAVTPWEDDELRKLVSDPNSRVFLEQKKIPVVLQPFHLQDCKSAVRDLLNASVDTYDKSWNGILLHYKNIKVTNKSASVAAETSGLKVEVGADFYIFRPEVGSILKGVVNKISNDHVGVLLYHHFNISCPRPSSEARSEKWLGNLVVMNQEVTLKLKDKNVSGRIPFFKGKLLEIGAVHEADKKSKKKKNKDLSVEGSIMESYDVPASSSTPTPLKRKHPDESQGVSDIKVKKSKKEAKVNEIGEVKNPIPELLELSSKKKKKKQSVGCVDNVDFIPRLSLDVSHLPEDLPPPNADSTHFDLAKISSSLSSKGEKKKNKTNHGLSAIKEESSDGRISIVNSMIDVTSKSQKSREEKEKKKKKEKEMKEDVKMNVSAVNDDLSLSMKKKEKKDKMTADKDAKKDKLADLYHTSLSEVGKKKCVQDLNKDVPKKEKKSKKAKSFDIGAPSIIDRGGISSLSLNPSDNVMGSQLPSKSMKKSKEKNHDVSTELKISSYGAPLAAAVPSGILKDSTKSKKKAKDEKISSPTKHAKKKKEKEPIEILSNDIASDEPIPAGQRVVQESPIRQSGIMKKRSSLSVSFCKTPEISYFTAGDSMMDPSLGKGVRPIPLMFVNVDRKFRESESPVKLSPVKRMKYDSDSDEPSPSKLTSVYPLKKEAKTSPPKKAMLYASDSDSDAPPPAKVIVSSSVRKDSSDSDDSEDNATPHKSAKQGYDSDDSDLVAAAQNKLLLSMGVMQSPLKTAKPNPKPDTSDSDSEGSVVTKHNNVVLSGQNKSLLPKTDKSIAVNAKSKKLILPTGNKNSPKKSSDSQASVARQSPKAAKSSKGKELFSSAPSGDNSDSDLDIEMMKRALLAVVAQPQNQSKPKPTNSQPAKRGSKKVEATPKAVAANKPGAKSKPLTQAKTGLKNISVRSEDSDSGPDDRNTTALVIEMRDIKEKEEKGKKKQTGKQTKSQKVVVSVSDKLSHEKPELKGTKAGTKKGKNPKGGNASKVPGDKNSKAAENEKKPKQKGKQKPTADEEISDVLQRLLKQAKMSVGVS